MLFEKLIDYNIEDQERKTQANKFHPIDDEPYLDILSKNMTLYSLFILGDYIDYPRILIFFRNGTYLQESKYDNN